jgi:hypothetical protein
MYDEDECEDQDVSEQKVRVVGLVSDVDEFLKDE